MGRSLRHALQPFSWLTNELRTGHMWCSHGLWGNEESWAVSKSATQGNFGNDTIWGRQPGCSARISSEAGSDKCQGMERNFPCQVVLLSVPLARGRLTAPGNSSCHSSGVTKEQPDFIFCMVTAACSWEDTMLGQEYGTVLDPLPLHPWSKPCTLPVSRFQFCQQDVGQMTCRDSFQPKLAHIYDQLTQTEYIPNPNRSCLKLK